MAKIVFHDWKTETPPPKKKPHTSKTKEKEKIP